jgi:hypothetical protein
MINLVLYKIIEATVRKSSRDMAMQPSVGNPGRRHW